MAAGEDEAQSVVNQRAITLQLHSVLLICGNARLTERRVLVHALAFTPPGVDGFALRRGDDPRGGIRRNPVAWPALERHGKRVLDCFFGTVEVAQGADQCRDDFAVFGAKNALNGSADLSLVEHVVGSDHRSQMGRISTAPPSWRWGILPARSTASSRSLASTMKKPPNCSLVSANGPSESSRPPPLTRSVVAVAAGRRRSPPRILLAVASSF